MSTVNIALSLEDANSIIMKARLASLYGGPILDKLRRISRYLESQIGEIITA